MIRLGILFPSLPSQLSTLNKFNNILIFHELFQFTIGSNSPLLSITGPYIFLKPVAVYDGYVSVAFVYWLTLKQYL